MEKYVMTNSKPVIKQGVFKDIVFNKQVNDYGMESAKKNLSCAMNILSSSILQYNDENSLSCVITLAYYNAISEYTLIREMPTGKGYADIVFLPHKDSDKPAMIVELKYDQSVESALAQIKNKQYSAIWDSYTGDVLLVGINYNKKSKMYDCRIEKVTKMTIGSYEK